MNTQPAYQYDFAGWYVGDTVADESPLEPGVYLIPARCTLTPPPSNVPQGQWPRWHGAAWQLVTKPASAEPDAVTKLAAFLAANPDVAALVQTDGVANV